MRISDWSSDVCSSDLEVERELDKRLLDLSPYEQNIFALDGVVNERGVFVDEDLCAAAKKIVARVTKALDDDMRETTGGGVDTCSQTHVLTAWLRAQGVDATSVAKDMLADQLIRDDLPDTAHRAEEHTSELQSLMRNS